MKRFELYRCVFYVYNPRVVSNNMYIIMLVLLAYTKLNLLHYVNIDFRVWGFPFYHVGNVMYFHVTMLLCYLLTM